MKSNTGTACSRRRPYRATRSVRLGDEIAASLKLPDMITNLGNQGAAPGRLTQAQFADFVKAEVVKWGSVVKSSGARAD